MILIASGAFVNPEFRAEFGLLPPAMLPLGNKRLVEHQIALLKRTFPNEKIAISLPETYSITPNEQRIFVQSKVHILAVNPALSLKEAMAEGLLKLEYSHEPLRVLYGDTLILDLPMGPNCIALAETEDTYDWEYEGAPDQAQVWCGYFSFSDPTKLQSVLKSSPNFIAAVRAYALACEQQHIRVQHWLDFGHINTYFKSRARFTTQRSFNALEIADGSVRKTGEPHKKIEAEMLWFESIPRRMRTYIPQLIEAHTQSLPPEYVLEYLPLPPLNEVFVHGQNETPYWRNVIRQCVRFLNVCAAEPLDSDKKNLIAEDFESLINEKTFIRLNQYFKQQTAMNMDSLISVNGIQAPKLLKVVTDCIARVRSLPAIPGVMHGDFCFSNILYDSRTGNIKVVDPRGMNSNGALTIFGDLRYDLAKLTHSLIGLYDHIVAGAYDCICSGDSHNPEFTLIIYGEDKIIKLQTEFLQIEFFAGVTMQSIMPLVVLLFLSMIPLHADKPIRQTTFLANAIRLYTTYVV